MRTTAARPACFWCARCGQTWTTGTARNHQAETCRPVTGDTTAGPVITDRYAIGRRAGPSGTCTSHARPRDGRQATCLDGGLADMAGGP
jgi:hypothetical protein